MYQYSFIISERLAFSGGATYRKVMGVEITNDTSLSDARYTLKILRERFPEPQYRVKWIATPTAMHVGTTDEQLNNLQPKQ